MSYAEIELLTWEQMYEELGLSFKDPWEFFYEKRRDAQGKMFDSLCQDRHLTLTALRMMPIADVTAMLADLNPKHKIEEPMVRAALPAYIERKLKG